MHFNKGSGWLPVLMIVAMALVGGAEYLMYNPLPVDSPIYQSDVISPPNTPVQTTSAQPVSVISSTATIDKSSLTQEVPQDASPILSGTAFNTAYISVNVDGIQAIKSAPVINGRWSTPLPNSRFSYIPGTYSIEIKDLNGKSLAKGVLAVIAPVTVDKNSLTVKVGEVTITGTAPSVSTVFIHIFQDARPNAVVEDATTSVISGKWSLATSLPVGTYDIWILDASKPIKWEDNEETLVQGNTLWYSGYSTKLIVQ